MALPKAKVLIIDDNEDVLLAARLLLKPHASLIQTEKNPKNIPNLLQSVSYDVIFLDMNFTKDMTSGQEGFFWLDKILKIDPSLVVILITAFGDIETAVKAVKEGATDFVLKPWQNEKFIATFEAALKLRKSNIEIQNLRTKQKQLSADIDHKFHNLVGSSQEMKKVFTTIEKVAATDVNILLLGENGTGKELVARALHRNSKRADQVFISVDMGAISPTLFESELFGHVRGAFTDAKEERAGRFEIASGGTLFLDEIGNISVELQSKLLSVLQSRQVARVGSNKYIPIDIRLICATNKHIYQLVKENKFRQDLLYRINTVEIQIPPLRKRLHDIPLLAEYFLNVYRKKYDKPKLKIDPLTLRRLQTYPWPGNVRELQHAVERCVIMCDSDIIQPADIFITPIDETEAQFVYDNLNLEEIEKSVIQKALSKFEGNITKAAKELGLTRTSLYRRMEKYGI